MPRTPFVDLGYGRDRTRIPILYEDTAVLAIDKPAGWLLVPFSWQRTERNLQAAITSSIAGGEYWAQSRGLKFLRFVHRLDGETTGVLLFAKSLGAVETYSELFESRQMRKTYLAVVRGVPRQTSWNCRAKLSPDPQMNGRMRVDSRGGKEAETQFLLLQSVGDCSLVEATPVTGRTHQIRIHLRESGHPVVGDPLYGPGTDESRAGLRRRFPLGLRSVRLTYTDPFRQRPVDIQAPDERFLRAFGFLQPDPPMTRPG
ncbi:MAG: RluA family pseudouridine synthase [Verrucomicrobia bacterium]|nr:RluA family pseudouridine synthase [Verrucomicrobiota bacterium]